MKHATPFLLLAAAVAMIPFGAARADVLYAKADATGAEDGSSWADAYTDFNAALKAALAANGAIDEIWVAGTMHATNDVQHNVKTELTIRGGFAGTESSADERADGVYSILDGIAADGSSTNAALYATGTAPLTIERIEFRNGFRNRNPLGAVVLGCTAADTYATVCDCRFTNVLRNFFSGGYCGGLYLDSNCKAIVTNCVFEAITVAYYDHDLNKGVVMELNSGAKAKVYDTRFLANGIPFSHSRPADANLAGPRGTRAMINVTSAALSLEDCEFRANRIQSRPGGIIKFTGACGGSSLKNCLFAGNQMTIPDNSGWLSNGAGAGIVQLARTGANAARNDWSLPVEGCTFAYNFYDAIGTGSLGGLFVDNGTANVTNCIFYGNAAGQQAVDAAGRGIYCTGYGEAYVADSCFESQDDLSDVSEGQDRLHIGDGVTFRDPKLFSTKADFQALFDSSVTTFSERGDVTAPQYARFRSDALSDALALDCNRIPVADEGDIVVAGSPAEIGTPSPAYGISGSYEAGDVVACSMAETVVAGEGTVRYYLAGWKLESYDPDAETGTPIRDSATSPEAGETAQLCNIAYAGISRLTWLWEARDVPGIASCRVALVDKNSISFDVDVSGIGYTAASADIKVAWGTSADNLVNTNTLGTVSAVGTTRQTLSGLDAFATYYVQVFLENTDGEIVLAPEGVLPVIIDPTPVEGVLYVKSDAPSADDGSSWGNACTDFNAALAAALAANGTVKEIWVAGTMHATNNVQHDVKTELTIRGGFAGTESAADERADGVYSVLDGIAADGSSTNACLCAQGNKPLTVERIEFRNGFRVVYQLVGAVGLGCTASGSFATVRDCRFTNVIRNFWSGGICGGLYVHNNCNAIVTNCVFEGIVVAFKDNDMNKGVALEIASGANVRVSDTRFLANGIPFGHNRPADATLAGARGTRAMINVTSASLVLENCEFRANRIQSRPGGIVKFTGACGGSSLKNCLFAGNQMTIPDNGGWLANGAGAGIVQLARTGSNAARNDWGLPVVGCTFAYNFYDAIGTGSLGGLYVDNGTAGVTNCIFYGNAAGQQAVGAAGRGIYCTGNGKANVAFSLFESANDLADVSDGQDCLDVGDGVLYGNPKFVSTKADFRALFDASATTFAENGDVTAPVFARFRSDALADALALDCHLDPRSPAMDAGDPASDWSLEPKPNGRRVNLGFYGNTAEATPSLPKATVLVVK